MLVPIPTLQLKNWEFQAAEAAPIPGQKRNPPHPGGSEGEADVVAADPR